MITHHQLPGISSFVHALFKKRPGEAAYVAGDLPAAGHPASSVTAGPPGDHDRCYMFGHLCVVDFEGACEWVGEDAGEDEDDGDEDDE